MEYNHQLQRFQVAAERFVAQMSGQAEVIGIILSGSFVHDTMDPNSDLDVFLVLDPSCNYRERGNTWINGVEVEYFMNPPAQIRAYMRTEVSPHTAHMLARGVVAYQCAEVVEQLVSEAKEVLDRRPPELKAVPLELARYHLDDLLKDLEDSRHRQDQLAQTLLRNQLLDQGIDLFCKIHRIHRAKHKRLSAQLAAIDPGFPDLLRRVATDTGAAPGPTGELADYLAGLLGGKRGKEWKLRSGLDL